MKHIVGFSGGADSQACALYVRNKFPKEDIILLNSDAGGNEHPMTEQFIADYSRNVFPVTVVQALIKDLQNRGTKDCASGDRRREFSDDDELTFDRLAYIEGRFPSRKAQFCTQRLKLEPQRRWIREQVMGEFDRWIGVRRDESDVRAHVLEEDLDDYFQCKLYRPLASWTKLEVFAYLQEAQEEVNPLYRMGFGRVGCAPCVNASKPDVRMWAARFPEMIDKVRGWEAQNHRTFFPPCVPGMEINWIDEVVAWSRTERGGKQLSLPIVEEEAKEGTCSSLWGLCE